MRPWAEAMTSAPLAPSIRDGLRPLASSAGRGGTPHGRSLPFSHLAELFFTTFCVPAEAHIGAGWVFAAAVCFVVRVEFGGLGTITRPVTAFLLIGKVQGSVQGASQEGVSFMGLRRTRSTGLGPGSRWLPRTREAGRLCPFTAGVGDPPQLPRSRS